VRGRVPLHVPVMHLDHAGKERGEEGDKENGKKENVFEGVISHKWQPCSTSNDTIVKYPFVAAMVLLRRPEISVTWRA
jgi:hypothetical protein